MDHHEIAIDYRNGVFAGTNDVVETVGETIPTTVEAFVEQNRQFYSV